MFKLVAVCLIILKVIYTTLFICESSIFRAMVGLLWFIMKY